MQKEALVNLMVALYGSDRWPKPLHILQGVMLFEQGSTARDAAKQVGTTETKLRELSQNPQIVSAILGQRDAAPTAEEIQRRRNRIGQMIVGKAAELAFEDIYRNEGPREFALEDYRDSHNETDYRMLDSGGRPVWRINIKFFGSLFRKARENVGLEPEDCFPLATYKVYSALKKQDEEHLAYIFVVVSVPGVTAVTVGEELADALGPIVDLLLMDSLTGKKTLEDRFVEHLAAKRHPAFERAYAGMRATKWYVMSAKRADDLLRKLLFDRVHAVRLPNFARNFRNAELDMHYSLKEDLTDLQEFFVLIKKGGLQQVSHMLAKGSI